MTYPHHDGLPLFQMIGKNVGIRRSRGRFVLATNVDILLDDATVRYLRDQLTPGTMLRADRYDVPGDLPRGAPFEQVLADCAKRFFHVNTRFGIFDVRQRRLLGTGTGFEANVLSFVVGLRILGLPDDASWSDRLRSIAGQAGAIFGATIMARLALLIDRMDFLINDFGSYIGGPAVAFTLLILLTLLVLFLSWRRRKLHPEAEEVP